MVEVLRTSGPDKLPSLIPFLSKCLSLFSAGAARLLLPPRRRPGPAVVDLRTAELVRTDLSEPRRGGQPPRLTGPSVFPNNPSRPLDGWTSDQKKHKPKGNFNSKHHFLSLCFLCTDYHRHDHSRFSVRITNNDRNDRLKDIRCPWRRFIISNLMHAMHWRRLCKWPWDFYILLFWGTARWDLEFCFCVWFVFTYL